MSFLIVSLIGYTASAQFTDQGNFLIGTTIGLSSASSRVIQNEGGDQNKGEGPSSLQFGFAPKVGYFPIDNLALGIGMDYTVNRVNQPNEDVNTDSDLLFGPFGRYFVPFGTGDMALFLEATVGFGSSSDNQEILGVTQNIHTNIFSVGIGPGITVISDEGLGVSATLKYNYARSKFDTDINNVQRQTITKSNVFDFSIGFQYYFGGLTIVRTDTGGRGF
ncbi:MAG: outer membrane beta-barrel protein [Lewinella sp.]|nr:outer membrane beta-barrel protein [Lewinella sp.]